MSFSPVGLLLAEGERHDASNMAAAPARRKSNGKEMAPGRVASLGHTRRWDEGPRPTKRVSRLSGFYSPTDSEA